MASLEKLVKAFEALKLFQPGSIPEELLKKKDLAVSRKDKISNCNLVADCICSNNLRNVNDFPKFLGLAMEMFLMLCDDDESDVRIVADECLNRTIKTLLETNLGRLQVELYKEIKRSGSSRCVRAALWRFADMCHLIRPQKCRPYIVNLLPCITKLSERKEEAVQETLASSMAKLCPVLMSFVNDSEIKVLLRAFLPNLQNASATTRRTAAQCLTLVCQHSRKPEMCLHWLLTSLLDMVLPVDDTKDVRTLVGVLLAMRHVVPVVPTHINNYSTQTHLHLLQMYQLLVYYSGHSDHNVVTSALETLHQLLKHGPSTLLTTLTTPSADNRTHIYTTDITACTVKPNKHSDVHLPSLSEDPTAYEDDDDQCLDSVATNVTPHAAAVVITPPIGDDNNSQISHSETDVSDQAPDKGGGREGSDAEHDGDDGDGSSNGEDSDNDTGDDVSIEELDATDTGYGNLQIGGDGAGVGAGGGGTREGSVSECSSLSDVPPTSTTEGGRARDTATTGYSSKIIPSDSIGSMSELGGSVSGLPRDDSRDALNSSVCATVNSSTEDLTANATQGPVIRAGNIGTMSDTHEAPLVYCVRWICSKLLLTGYSGTSMHALMPDRYVRVSVKSLALSCVATAVGLMPALLVTKLHVDTAACNSSDGGDGGATVDGDAGDDSDLQMLTDVLLYKDHCDPQIKGTTALLVGNFVRSTLIQCSGNIPQLIRLHPKPATLQLSTLLDHLYDILSSDLSLATRLALVALRSCLTPLISSLYCYQVLNVLIALFAVKDNPYWLVKVELLELLGDLDYKCLHYLEHHGRHLITDNQYLGFLSLQEYIIERIILNLLGDDNNRVRHAAAAALVRMIPLLFYISDNPQQDAVITTAYHHTYKHMDTISLEWTTCSGAAGNTVILGPVPPYSHHHRHQHTTANNASTTAATHDHVHHSPATEPNLSRVVAIIINTLTQATSKHLTSGCCHALSLLSEEYSICEYSDAWCCSTPTPATTATTQHQQQYDQPAARSLSTGSTASSCSILSQYSVEDIYAHSAAGSLSSMLCILTATPQGTLDLTTHTDGLKFSANLFAGAAYKCLRNIEQSTDTSWPALSNRMLVPLADHLFSHLAKMLNVCAHIISDNVPGPPQSKSTLPSLPNPPSLSPIKRKAKSIRDDTAHQLGASTVEKEKAKAHAKAEKDKEKENEKLYKDGLGTFYNIPHYMKIYDVLKGAYSNYKISLNLSSLDKFGSLLESVLCSLVQVLEVCSLNDVGRYAEEMLSYLKHTVLLDATNSILCVQQLLKALFGTNLASQYDHNTTTSTPSCKPGKAARLTSAIRPGLYHYCFTAPYTQFTQSIASATFRAAAHTEQDESNILLGWLRKRGERKVPAVLRPSSKADKATIASYIRLFEPLVIKALKQYTVSSCLMLQQQVLDLLSQLVQLRVNYCLLDSDQIFIAFVIKQFEYIEEGQIRHAETLIPHIFHFLVLLSYERYHSKTIIGMPKIIQLCDGIIASGQQPITHAIPALQPIIHDLFVLRGTMKGDPSKELDTQREVVVSMLLRLNHYYQVLEMLTVVLQQSRRDSDEKWKRLSRQVMDAVLPQLAALNVNITHQHAVDGLHHLFESVAPSVFRPVDTLLQLMLTSQPTQASCELLERWLAFVIIVMRVLIVQSKEEVVLSRLKLVDLVGKAPQKEPDKLFAKFLLSVIGTISAQLSTHSHAVIHEQHSYEFLYDLLARLLLYLTHMLQSGLYRRVATCMSSLINQSESSEASTLQYTVDDMNKAFLHIGDTHPTTTLQWCNVLILLSYRNLQWWKYILCTQQRNTMSSHISICDTVRQEGEAEGKHNSGVAITTASSNASSSRGGMQDDAHMRCCSREVIRRGALILFCDFVCENLSDVENMTWLIINHVYDIIELSHEPPVQDFISAIHRNSAASGLLLQAIQARCDETMKASVIVKTLVCLESLHLSQTGALLSLLLEQYLSTNHLTIAKRCDGIVCNRLEMLLADNSQEKQSQLSLDELNHLIRLMSAPTLVRRHARLVSLLHKLHSQYTNTPYSHTTDTHTHNSAALLHPLMCRTQNADIIMTKEWFNQITLYQCCSESPDPQECAHLLSCLDYTPIATITMHQDFNMSILAACVSLGLELTYTMPGNRPISTSAPPASRTSHDYSSVVSSTASDTAGSANEATTSTSASTNGSATSVSDRKQITEPPVLPPPSSLPNVTLSPLLVATQQALLYYTQHTVTNLPSDNTATVTVSNEGGIARLNTGRDQLVCHTEEMILLYKDAGWVDRTYHIAEGLVRLIQSLIELNAACTITNNVTYIQALCRFTLLCLQHTHWVIVECNSSGTSHRLEVTLQLVHTILQLPAAHLAFNANARYVASTVYIINRIIASLLLLPKETLSSLSSSSPSSSSTSSQHPATDSVDIPDGSSLSMYDIDLEMVCRSCDEISEMLSALPTLQQTADSSKRRLVHYVAHYATHIITSLSRLSLLNSYTRTPPLVWKMGWTHSPLGSNKIVPPPPLDYLQDKEVLLDFIYRVNTIGWTSRQQFEETWMSLLGVLNPQSIDEAIQTSPEEDIERTHTVVLAIRGITTLLLHTQLVPQPGNPVCTTVEHRTRDKPLAFLHTKNGKKLCIIRSLIEREIYNLSCARHAHTTAPSSSSGTPAPNTASTPALPTAAHIRQAYRQENIERYLSDGHYQMGQLSIESLWLLIDDIDHKPAMDSTQMLTEDVATSETDTDASTPNTAHPQHAQPQVLDSERPSDRSGLDIHSCIQLLQDLYSQFLATASATHIPLMQLNETIKSLLIVSDLFSSKSQYEWMLDALLQVHKSHPQDDEVTTQYLISAIAKAAAVCTCDNATSEKIVKLIESGYKSTFVPCRVSAMFASLYMLEAGSTEVTKQLTAITVDYFTKQMAATFSVSSDNHQVALWSVMFYILENYQDEMKDQSLVDKLLQHAISGLSAYEESTPVTVYMVIIRGLERLLLADVFNDKQIDSLIKTSIDRLCQPNSQRALAALGLMLTCVYSGKHVDDWSTSSHDLTDQQYILTDPESLIVAMERVTVLFDRIKKGYPYEARVLTRVLPTFLTDFFPPQDIMNKVIGEFLSSQQPHPQLMAGVVFKVFEHLLQTDQQTLVRDWVMLSLSNFTQRTPTSMAIWSLTCFFISASCNSWLRALFPHVVKRIGRLTQLDTRLFCIAALDFRRQLGSNANHQKAFQATFQAISQPNTPYAQLLALCN